MFKKIPGFFKRPLGITLLIIGAIIAFVILKNSRPQDPLAGATLARAEVGDITETVSVTGRVKPAQDASLSFEKSGKVSRIYVKVGDLVVQGASLASLENGELAATVAQYQAALEVQQIKLAELKKGSRPEEINSAQIDLKNANDDIANLYETAPAELEDVYDAAAYAVNRLTDELFINDESNFPTLSFDTSDSQAQTNSQNQRVIARIELEKFQSELAKLASDRASIDAELLKAKQHLTITRTFLGSLTDAVNSAYGQSGTVISQTTLNTYRTNVSTAQTNIATALTEVNTRIQGITSAKLTAQKMANALVLIQAGSTPETIAAQEAAVRQAQATVDNYRAQLAKSILRAPFSGIITVQNLKLGEIAVANTPAISLISQATFQIEANISEADIAKVKEGNSAAVELDAYPGEPLAATVSLINPAETLVEGIATYKVTLEFTVKDDRVKSGMSADVDIVTNQKTGILVVPQRAVITKNGEKIVRVVEDGVSADRPVVSGIRGNGKIEIISGLNVGDTVITSSE